MVLEGGSRPPWCKVHCVHATDSRQKGSEWILHGIKKPMYVCSRRQQGCKAVYCGDCWGNAIVSLKRPRRSGVSLKPPRRGGRVQSNL